MFRTTLLPLVLLVATEMGVQADGETLTRQRMLDREHGILGRQRGARDSEREGVDRYRLSQGDIFGVLEWYDQQIRMVPLHTAWHYITCKGG